MPLSLKPVAAVVVLLVLVLVLVLAVLVVVVAGWLGSWLAVRVAATVNKVACVLCLLAYLLSAFLCG